VAIENSPEHQARIKSTELLRVVLGKMGTHGDGYEPNSYAVWYEYARGGIGELRDEIDALTAKQPRLSSDQTVALYDKYLRDRSEEVLANARLGLLAVLAEIQGTIERATSESGAFHDTLQSFAGALSQADDSALKQQLSQVVAQTGAIRESLGSLGEELSDNKAQVTRLTEELSRLREDVLTDPLTGLVNRRGFDAAITALKAAAESDGEPFSLVMIDIDHFKRINDTHGHLVGDRVIQKVASTMKACVRGGDTAVRYGGEEFALLLPTTGANGAQTVAEYVRNALQRADVSALKKGEAPVSVTVSAGVAVFIAGEAAEECIRRADQALYAAKSGGRNRVVMSPGAG
jgi:diguanylate cyclase